MAGKFEPDPDFPIPYAEYQAIGCYDKDKN